VQNLVDQGKKHGFAHLGTIGNLAHLKKHGDHTPWSAGKKRGRIYAKDTDTPDWGEEVLLALCRNQDYDTQWMDFFNINHRQFDNAGHLLATNHPDGHLHLSVNVGFENRPVTLFDDMVAFHQGTRIAEIISGHSPEEADLMYWRLKFIKPDGAPTNTTYLSSGTGCKPLTADADRFFKRQFAAQLGVTGTRDRAKVIGSQRQMEETFGPILPMTTIP